MPKKVEENTIRHFTVEIMKRYNKTKGGTVTKDTRKLLGEYTVKRPPLRWPLLFFYNIVDVTGLASYIIYGKQKARLKAKDLQRKFLKEFADMPCMP